jgi:NRPS condensation-like uncharacterized protein
MDALPRRFPARLNDRLSVCLDLFYDLMIQLELEFAERLDADRLARALRLALDAEPILGCRLVEGWLRSHWERLDEADLGRLLVTESEDEYEAFKVTSLDPHTGPQLKACLWRAADGDRLLFKVTDIVTDGGGFKEAVAMVSGLYARLADDPDHRPEPNLQGSRSAWQVLRRMPWWAVPRSLLDLLRDLWFAVARPTHHGLPIDDGPRTPLTFLVRELEADRIARLAAWGRARDATLNDLLVAGVFRALAAEGNWDGQAQLRLAMTIDLRRYLPSGRGAAIANLSAVALAWPCLGTELGADFPATLARVAEITRYRKGRGLGLTESLAVAFVAPLPHAWARGIFRHVWRQQVEQHNHQPALTNMGPIDPDTVTFGTRPQAARLLPPPGYPPGFLAGLSGYDGSLTLSAGVYPTQREIMGRFLDRVLAELPE